MSENDAEFLALDSGYQHLLRLAQDRYGITISLLQKLSGGKSGALLYLISISSIDRQELRILKLEPLATRSDARQSDIAAHWPKPHKHSQRIIWLNLPSNPWCLETELLFSMRLPGDRFNNVALSLVTTSKANSRASSAQFAQDS